VAQQAAHKLRARNSAPPALPPGQRQLFGVFRLHAGHHDLTVPYWRTTGPTSYRGLPARAGRPTKRVPVEVVVNVAGRVAPGHQR